jgi:hypothetical protein
VSVIPIALDSRACRELGWALIERAKAAEEAERTGRLELTEAGIVRLAEIIAAGSSPTVGFWRRYGTRVSAS